MTFFKSAATRYVVAVATPVKTTVRPISPAILKIRVLMRRSLLLHRHPAQLQ